MTEGSNIISLQARWGFFISVGLLGILALVKIFYKEYLAANWEAVRIERESDLRLHIQAEFQRRVAGLAGTAGRVIRDPATLQGLTSNRTDDIVRAFRRLRASERNSGSVVEVVDAKGTLVGWGGAKGLQRFDRFTAGTRDTMVILTPAGLRSYLSVAIQVKDLGLTVIASNSFDINPAVSNRFVSQESFRHALEARLGREIEVIEGMNDPATADERRIRVGLTDLTGGLVATVLVAAPTLESELQVADFTAGALMSGLFSLLIAALALFFMSRLLQTAHGGLRLLFVLVAIWCVRYAWLWAEFPSSLMEGWLFDPAHYASPFAWGLASSLGELTISVSALFLSVVLIARELGRLDPQSEGRGRGGLMGFAVVGLIGFLGLNILLRSYGAVIRSVVYDSTLTFVNPSEIVPSAEVVLMYVNILAVTCGLLILFTAVTRFFVNWYLIRTKLQSSLSAFIAVGSLYGLAVVLFRMFDKISQVPWYGPVVMFVFVLLLVKLSSGKKGGVTKFAATPGGMAFVTVLAFIVSTPVLDMKIHEKEEDRLRLYANELAQPVDAWLSFVTNESFRSVAESYRDLMAALQEESASRAIAFPLWARTLTSREGYNSTLVFYDESGNEADRFAVGMTEYEQTQLLQRLFEVDEEVLNVVERRVPGGLIKYYGIWGSIRDTSDRPVAYAALVLAASEQALFRGETPEPLRPFAKEEVSQLYQSLYISEYQDGRLVASSDLYRQAGTPLPAQLTEALAGGEGPSQRITEEVRGRSFETLYVIDQSRPGRIIALSLEPVGVRWHLFNLVKVATLYGVILAVGSGILIMSRWRRYRFLVVGFRGRLIVAFLIVAILPLFLFGYYNREFAEERQAVNVTNRLNEDLDLIKQRIVSSIVDEDDIEYGITDDFCKAVASEFGVDFTIFRRDEVAASSRPELYSSGLIDARLPGEVFAEIVIAGHGYAQTRESIGDITYAVGFQPLVINERTAGVIAVPALYRQSELEAEVAERNAFTLAVYGVLVLLTSVLGIVIANQLSQPVHDLTNAAHEVGGGNLDVRVGKRGSGEIQDLVATFNEMVTELRKSREELNQAERERAWKEMAKQVAHEIKNPLTPMKLSVQHLRQAFKDNTPDLGDLVGRITQTLTEQIDALARIATEFSSFARMPGRKFERIDLHGLLLEAVQLFHEVRGIEIQTNFCDTTPALIADREELRRVIINIIRNAIQAMEQKGRIAIQTSTEAKECTISVTDTGPGIPSALQEKVFEPNFSTKTDGMGLGLALARRVVEDLNGTIRLESAEGKGTTIFITLPMIVGPNG